MVHQQQAKNTKKSKSQLVLSPECHAFFFGELWELWEQIREPLSPPRFTIPHPFFDLHGGHHLMIQGAYFYAQRRFIRGHLVDVSTRFMATRQPCIFPSKRSDVKYPTDQISDVELKKNQMSDFYVV